MGLQNPEKEDDNKNNVNFPTIIQTAGLIIDAIEMLNIPAKVPWLSLRWVGVEFQALGSITRYLTVVQALSRHTAQIVVRRTRHRRCKSLLSDI